MKKTKAQKGITLIALIITIIVLLILAVVSIKAIQGDGIISKAKQAAAEYGTKQDEERDILSQYELMIAEQTGEAWKANKDEDGKEVSFTKGDVTVTLGDIVNYTATGFSGQWKVLGVEKGQLLLVSASNVANSISLYGYADYNGGGIIKLNQACANCLNTDYATEARSIKVEDINRITGFDPTTYSEYGSKYTYKKNNQNTRYLTYKVNNGEEQTQDLNYGPGGYEFILPEGKNWNGEWSEEIESTGYIYSNPVISSMFSNDLFFLASPIVSAGSMIVGLGWEVVSNGNVMDGGFLWTSRDEDSSSIVEFGVRAVVALKSDIQLTPNGEHSWNIQSVN